MTENTVALGSVATATVAVQELLIAFAALPQELSEQLAPKLKASRNGSVDFLQDGPTPQATCLRPSRSVRCRALARRCSDTFDEAKPAGEPARCPASRGYATLP